MARLYCKIVPPSLSIAPISLTLDVRYVALATFVFRHPKLWCIFTLTDYSFPS